MSLVERWLSGEPSQLSQLSQVSQYTPRENERSRVATRTIGFSSSPRLSDAFSCTPTPAKAAKPAKVIAWIKRPDVVTVVEDLFRERWHPGRIARELGLTRGEVRTILRVADRQDSADMAENYRTQRRRR